MSPARSLAAEADEHVPFATACSWARISAPSPRGARDSCPKCGEGALKVWPDHAFCFACRAYLTVTRLLALAWELSEDDAAAQALDRIGWVPASFAHLWEDSSRQPAPDRGELERALKAWCAAAVPDWAARQYDQPVARKLSLCLGLLADVHTEADCTVWMDGCRRAMGRVLGSGD